MKKLILSLALLLTSLAALAGGSSPGLYYGQVPTAAQWNSYFAAKLDYTPGAVNTVPYWDGGGNLLSALISGDCTAVANVFTCTSTSLAGGSLGAVPYQSATDTTAFLLGNTTTTPQFFTSTGTGAAAQAPTWTGSTGFGNVVLDTNAALTSPDLGTPSALVGTNITGTAAGLSIGGSAATATNIAGGTQWGVLYQSASGVTASTAAGSAGQVLTSNGSSAPTFQDIGSPFAAAIHAATSKTTPIGADEFGIYDSVSTTLNKVTFTNALNFFAASAGDATKSFSVAAGTTGAHAARVDQIALFPTVTSAAAPDIFGAAGATINYDNSTPVTMTSIAACSSGQVGSIKRLIPSANVTVTASANLVVDGATSGNFILPANAEIDVRSETTTKFIVTTISAYGSCTPDVNFDGGNGDKSVAVQVCRWEKIGRMYHVEFYVVFSETTASGNLQVTGVMPEPASSLTNMYVHMPFAVNSMTSLSGGIFGLIVPATSVILMHQNATGSYSTITNANTGSGSMVSGSFEYSI